jgi:ATP-dependent DNA helicase RecQ
LNSVLNKKDTMAVMPTGGGKSLCFQMPAIFFNGIVVVVSPLIALMRDQVQSLQRLGIPGGAIYSGQTPAEKRIVFDGIKSNKHFILYLSPERVQREGFALWIKKQNVALFAIDEAHCVSQWGSDFREDYHRLKLLRELRPDVPILALTATATPEVLDDISKQLKLQKPDRHVYGFYRKNLFYQVVSCGDFNEKLSYLQQAIVQNPQGRILIYCGTRKQTESVASFLKNKFDKVGFYHAGLSSDERTEIQNELSTGKLRILAATNAFGMGIDHSDVRLVVHMQMPANIESFYQEMGRAGRDERDSTCLLLYAKKDKGLHAYFINSSSAEPSMIRRRWSGLEAITQFAEGGECRHGGILTYFRDTQRIKSCGHCDICLPDSSRMISKPEGKFVIPAEAISTSKKKKSSSKNSKSNPDEPLSPPQEVRVDVLKLWRKEYADANDIPAFIVFSNKTLRDLAIKNPSNETELLKVYGMGPHKVEHFGALILERLGSCR